MILTPLYEDNYYIFMPHMLFILMLIITCLYYLFPISNIYFIISTVILMELIYHLAPRTEEDKKRGRNMKRVIFHKLDAFIDTGLILLLLGMVNFIYDNIITYPDKTLEVLKLVGLYVGYSIAIIIVLILFLLLNKLRDTPRR